MLDGEGALLATMDKNFMSLSKWTIKDAKGRVVASTATVPGLAKYGVQLRLPSSSKPALMCAPTGDLRSLGVWQCGEQINRDDGQEYAEAAYGRCGIMRLRLNAFLLGERAKSVWRREDWPGEGTRVRC